MKNKVNIGYLTALALMVTTSRTGILEANSGSMTLTNESGMTIHVQINYQQDHHTHDEGSQVTVPAGNTATGSWTDNLKSVYASPTPMATNSVGYYDGSNLPTGAISLSTQKIQQGSSHSVGFIGSTTGASFGAVINSQQV